MTKAEAVKPLKAVGLEVQDCMRLRAVSLEFDPAQNLYLVAGDNAQGKSTLLNVIAMLIGGRRMDPPRVIRDGADEARAELPLDDGHVVRGVWKQGMPGRIEVLSPDGVPMKAPQAWLNERVGRYSFDPVAFLSLKEADQRDEVLKALGLDFAALDHEREERFAERTLVNREVDRFKARLTALPKPPADAPEAVDLQALITEKNRLAGLQQEKTALTASAREAAMKRDALAQEHRTCAAAIKDMEAQQQALEQRLANARAQLQGIEERGKKTKEEARQAQVLAEQAPDVDLEMADVDMKLAEADALTEAARKAKEREQLGADLKKKEEEAHALTKRIDGIDAEKDAMLAKAKFPVEGLGFTSSGLKFKGLAFSQASQAERLRVSVALGLISKPELRILLVREGSLLDDKSMGLLAQVAREYDAQVVVEVVGKNRTGPMIIIEDGAVAEVRK